MFADDGVFADDGMLAWLEEVTATTVYYCVPGEAVLVRQGVDPYASLRLR